MDGLRNCMGSARFGIEAHEAPVAEFPVQPSQKGGLGRLCKTHWAQYTTALRKAAAVAKTGAARVTDAPDPEAVEAKPSRKRKTSDPVNETTEGAAG